MCFEDILYYRNMMFESVYCMLLNILVLVSNVDNLIKIEKLICMLC